MVELRKVDAIIIVLCVAVLAFGVWQMTKARSPVDGQLAVASKPYELAAGDNTIGAVTVTTILDPEQFLFDVGDLCTAVDGFLIRGDLLVNNAIVTTTLSVGTNISMSNGYIFNSKGAVTVTDQLLVDSQVTAANGLAATGAVTVTGVGSFSSQLTASNGLAATGAVTVTGPGSFSSQLTASNGIVAGGNISMSTGGLINSQGAVTVTDQLQVDSQLIAQNGIAATGGITTASGGALVMTAGSIWDDSRYLYLMDDVFIGGATQINGPITSTAGLLQLGNNGVVTGTFGVSSQINAANGVAVTGAVTATGALSGASIAVTGAASWTTFLSGGIPAPAAYITVTTNSYITPTYTLQPLTSADAVFTANLAAGAAGRLLILWNVANTTITISDTGTIMLSADWAGTQYDTLTLISDGTNWLEISRSTN